MSRESNIYTILAGDATLLATLTGGVYKKESTGIEGISRETTPAAFSSGFLQPCALVRQRSFVPDGALRDMATQQVSTREVVEVYIYGDGNSGYTAIDTAKARVYALLQGVQLSDSFELALINIVPRMREMDGPLRNASMERLDFEVYSLFG